MLLTDKIHPDLQPTLPQLCDAYVKQLLMINSKQMPPGVTAVEVFNNLKHPRLDRFTFLQAMIDTLREEARIFQSDPRFNTILQEQIALLAGHWYDLPVMQKSRYKQEFCQNYFGSEWFAYMPG